MSFAILDMSGKKVLVIGDSIIREDTLLGLFIDQIVCSEHTYERFKHTLDMYEVPVILI